MHMIPLAQLAAHPGNANRMPPEMFKKLVAHIRESGDYPPIIVRPLTCESSGDSATSGGQSRFQILDGHHRVRALAQLGRDQANCDIWQADDERAALLLLTLNRLQGSDDPVKRAQLLAQLAETHELQALAARLPEDRAKIARLLALKEPPPEIAPPPELASMPQAVTFFLTAGQRDCLLARLREVHHDRSTALLMLLKLDGAAA